VMTYVVSRYSEDGDASRHVIRMLVTDSRILIPGLAETELFRRNAPAGVHSALFREDRDDLILFGDGIDAYWFRSRDLTLIGWLLKSLSLGGVPTALEGPERVGRFALRGFETTLLRYEAGEEATVDVYLTEDLGVNWGLLGGSWLFGSGGLGMDELNMALRRGAVPARVEVKEGGARSFSLNLMVFERMPIDRRAVAKPPMKVFHTSTDLLLEMLEAF